MRKSEEEESICVGSVLRELSQTLASACIQDGHLEAELLLAHVLGVRRIDLFLDPTRVVCSPERARLKILLRERLDRKPIQHLIEKQEFWGRDFWTPSGVFIPRPETEGIIELALGLSSGRQPRTIIDLGCGSGCLAVTLALLYPEAQVFAIDRSVRALTVARANLAVYGAADRIRFFCSDLTESFGNALEGRIDLVVSNPPYLSDGDRDGIQPEVSRYEPPEALFAGSRGTELIDRLLQDTRRLLSPGGSLLIEIGATQGNHVLGRGLELGWKVEVKKDFCGRDRYAVLQG